jgi:hypothetical protein
MDVEWVVSQRAFEAAGASRCRSFSSPEEPGR